MLSPKRYLITPSLPNNGAANYQNGRTGKKMSPNIQAIGIDNAAMILYYSLAYLLQERSQFADARIGVINAATILFGDCSFEVIQTANAWSAVGVGEVFATTNLEGPDEICTDLLPVSWEAFSLTGANFLY